MARILAVEVLIPGLSLARSVNRLACDVIARRPSQN